MSTIFETLASPSGAMCFIAACTPLTAVIFEKSKWRIADWIQTQQWWSTAMPQQKTLMNNMGWDEAKVSELDARVFFGFVVAICFHHALCGFLMVPVAALGWEEAGPVGHAAFALGVLLDISIQLYDEVRQILTAFCHESIGKKLFGGEPLPMGAFIVGAVLHHPLELCMLCPMLVLYPSLRAFHLMGVAMLVSVGVCYLAGQYKFSLDVRKRGELRQLKAILVVQVVALLFSRVYVFPTQALVALQTFQRDGNMVMYYAGTIAAVLMSLFNLVLIVDGIGALFKWLPRTVEHGLAQQTEVSGDAVDGCNKCHPESETSCASKVSPHQNLVDRRPAKRSQ